MSFNGSGIYVPPAGQPVAAGTVIQSSTFNSLITDIGNTFNNVLPRDGQAAMAAQLKLIDGTSSMPGIAFNSEASTGIFRPMTGTLALVASGVEIMRINNAGRVLIGTTADDGVNRLQVNGGAAFTGTVTGITKTMVGLGNVDNTSDVNKPVSTAASTALNLKAPLASPALTGRVTINQADDGVNALQVTGRQRISNGANGALILTHGYNFSSANYGLKLDGDVSASGAGYLSQNAGSGGFQLSQGATYYGGGNSRTDTNATSACSITGLAGVLSFFTDSGLTANTNFSVTERMRISASGNLLINTAVDNGSDRLQVNGNITATGIFGKVNSAATLSRFMDVTGSTTGATFGSITNTGGSLTWGVERNVGGNLFNNSLPYAGVIGTANSVTPLQFGVNNNIVAMLDTSGNLLVGATAGSNHSIRKNVNSGSMVLGIGPSAGESHRFYVADTGGANAATAAYSLDKIGATSRSINAAGTINASGADYAEYMRKAANSGDLAKGQVVGVNADGLLTDKWDDAVSFMVKTTNPSYVGGDTWGSEEAIGVVKPMDPEHETYAADLAAFEAALEAARQTVDRIAFAGQVPVNVTGAKPGQYIVPGNFGGIVGGVAMNAEDMTMPMYLRAVGIVQNILPDGRANVRVKVA